MLRAFLAGVALLLLQPVPGQASDINFGYSRLRDDAPHLGLLAEMPNSLRRFIRWAPKAELHVHIEGTLEPEMMMRFAARNGLPSPYPSVEAARTAYNFSDLQDFLDLYYYGCSVLRTRADFYELAMAYFRRAVESRVVHVEVFFDPQTHLANGLPFDTFMSGLVDAAVDAEEQMPITVSYIMCFRRDMTLSTAQAALTMSLPWRHRIVAVGLDSTEVGIPPARFKAVFERAEVLGFQRVAHVGEEGPPEYIWQALQVLHAQRIDHGIHCMDDPALVSYLNTTRIALTLCPISNFKLKVYGDKLQERLGELLRSGLAVTVNSDDAAYFGAYLSENFEWLAQVAGLDVRQVAQLVVNGFQASFSLPKLTGGVERRQQLVEQVWQLAAQVEAEMAEQDSDCRGAVVREGASSGVGAVAEGTQTVHEQAVPETGVGTNMEVKAMPSTRRLRGVARSSRS